MSGRVPDSAAAMMAQYVCRDASSVERQLFLARLHEHVEEEKEEARIGEDEEIRHNSKVNLAMSRARKLGCLMRLKGDIITISHPKYPKYFTIKKDVRYVGRPFLRWLEKVEEWLAREYAPQPTVSLTTPEPAAEPEPEPEELAIPDVLAPTVMANLTIYTIHAPLTTGRPYWTVRAYDTATGRATYRDKFTVHDSLEQARTKGVPTGLCKRERRETDDITIVESWV